MVATHSDTHCDCQAMTLVPPPPERNEFLIIISSFQMKFSSIRLLSNKYTHTHAALWPVTRPAVVGCPEHSSWIYLRCNFEIGGAANFTSISSWRKVFRWSVFVSFSAAANERQDRKCAVFPWSGGSAVYVVVANREGVACCVNLGVICINGWYRKMWRFAVKIVAAGSVHCRCNKAKRCR